VFFPRPATFAGVGHAEDRTKFRINLVALLFELQYTR
jgi:hypothetical protein